MKIYNSRHLSVLTCSCCLASPPLYTLSLLYFHPTRPPPSTTLFPYTTLFRSPAIRPPSSGGTGTRLNRFSRTAVCQDRKSTRLNSSHRCISYAVFCLKKKKE